MVASGARAWLTALLSARSDVWVQDPASSRALADIAGLSPGVILDLCAGQGTKTRQLSALFPNARIFASDPDGSRSQVLRQVFAGSARVKVVPPQEIRETQEGKADLILLDVPCSNTGVLARRTEAKYRAGPAQLSRLAAIQQRIVADAAPLLSPRGMVLYSTCSLDEEENRTIASSGEKFGLRIQRETLTLPAGRPGGEASDYHDGSYSALLSRARSG
jgi:16S rRNA (cytosine967-C5)-methyltransferase